MALSAGEQVQDHDAHRQQDQNAGVAEENIAARNSCSACCRSFHAGKNFSPPFLLISIDPGAGRVNKTDFREWMNSEVCDQ
jgi:hypothetical protein